MYRFCLLVIAGISLLGVAGCQELMNWRVQFEGHTTPRNHREQLIFDYLYALQQERYRDAYNLVALEGRGQFRDFAREKKREHQSLPTSISIGKEQKTIGDGECDYSYTVFVAIPHTSKLMSGEIGFYPNPEKPGTCRITYNSAI